MKSTVLVLALASLAAASAELKIDVTRKVKCERKTQKGDQVKMHYHGSLESNGEKFDASYDRGQPLAFKLGTGQVIKGWDEGLLDMCIGEKRTLTIPPSSDTARVALAQFLVEPLSSSRPSSLVSLASKPPTPKTSSR
uniref:peptidylprolyl isomerase n=1 Tax=Bionectria ochroleuca TaxID=29856 RepID=A0A8H7TMY1_BIOOC